MEVLLVLKGLLAVLALSALTAFVFHKLRLPTIAGFLIAGFFVGRGGLGLVEDRHDVETLAEVGVVLLLFGIGLEVSLRDMLRLRAAVFGGGTLQLLLTLGAFALLLRPFGIELRQGAYLGALLALSSTAIVLRILTERGETAAPHARTMLGILVYQDLAVVPLMLLVPFLGGQAGGASEMLVAGGKAAAVVAGMLLVAHVIFPRLMHQVVRTRNRELFTLCTILVALGTAYVSGLAGLSLALGAFIAGMVLAESDYAQQVIAEITPLRDAFNSLFFVSIGMLLDPETILHEPLLVAALVASVIAVKAIIAGAVALLLGHVLRVAILTGLGLAQVGEFSFVLAQVGSTYELIPKRYEQLFLAVSVISMTLTPFIMALGARLGRLDLPFLVLRLRRPGGKAGAEAKAEVTEHSAHGLEDHVIIVGYGLNGRNVARVLRKLGIRHLAIELNASTVRSARAEGEQIVFGDATRSLVLEHLGVERARAVIVTVADAAASRQVVATARRMNRNAYIAVRTRFEAEVDALHGLGANEVVPEEFETSLALAGAVMATYGATPHAVEREKLALRKERYQVLRRRGYEYSSQEGATLAEMLASIDIVAQTVPPQSPFVGRTLRQLDLRANTGCSVIAVERRGEVLPNPGADLEIEGDDRLVLVGRAEELERAKSFVSDSSGVTP